MNRNTGPIPIVPQEEMPIARDLADYNGHSPESATTVTTREVRTGCIGREHAGKTALFRALMEGPVGEYFPSGLHMDVGNPQQAAQMMRVSEQTRRLLELSGLPPTMDAEPMHYYLFDGDDQLAAFCFQEVVGQILTHTLPDSSPEQQSLYDTYVSSLLDVNVLWTLIPCPPPKPKKRDRRRYAHDLRISAAFLREALRKRTVHSPCVVALVLTKIDSLFDSEAAARQALTEDVLLDSLTPLVNTVFRSERVTDSAIFPVSSFGFGNSVRHSSANGRGSKEEDPYNPFTDEPVWLLKEDADVDPFNLTTLLIWTMLFGVLAQNDTNDPDVTRMLQDDLEEHQGWYLPIKGRQAPEV